MAFGFSSSVFEPLLYLTRNCPVFKLYLNANSFVIWKSDISTWSEYRTGLLFSSVMYLMYMMLNFSECFPHNHCQMSPKLDSSENDWAEKIKLSQRIASLHLFFFPHQLHARKIINNPWPFPVPTTGSFPRLTAARCKVSDMNTLVDS